jgi:hypothetical protein
VSSSRCVGVLVEVGVSVGVLVEVGVSVGVLVEVGVSVGTGVHVGVDVAVFVDVGVALGPGVGPPNGFTTIGAAAGTPATRTSVAVPAAAS